MIDCNKLFEIAVASPHQAGIAVAAGSLSKFSLLPLLDVQIGPTGAKSYVSNTQSRFVNLTGMKNPGAGNTYDWQRYLHGAGQRANHRQPLKRRKSIPMRTLSPACRSTISQICFGTEAHRPRHSLRPTLSMTQTTVISCETSNPTKRVINEPPTVRITGQRATRIAILSADHAPTAIIGCQTCQCRHVAGWNDLGVNTYDPPCRESSLGFAQARYWKSWSQPTNEAAARQPAALASKRHLLQHRSCSRIAQGPIRGATLFDARDFTFLLAQDLAN
jgi:hypothetical protein